MLENLITELIAALKENTAAHSGKPAAAPLAVVEDAPKKKAPKTKSEPKPEPEPAAAEEPAETEEPIDVTKLVKEITDTVVAAIQNAGADAQDVKDKWTAIRAGFGVTKVSELSDRPDELVKALAAAKEL